MNHQRISNQEIKKVAKALGFEKCGGTCHGQLIFKKQNKFISHDCDGHNGGFWKVATSADNLCSKTSRSYTADRDLNRIAD